MIPYTYSFVNEYDYDCFFAEAHSYIKDIALVASLIIAVGGCWFAYVHHHYSQNHVKKMMKDLETLQRAEDALQELQEK